MYGVFRFSRSQFQTKWELTCVRDSADARIPPGHNDEPQWALGNLFLVSNSSGFDDVRNGILSIGCSGRTQYGRRNAARRFLNYNRRVGAISDWPRLAAYVQSRWGFQWLVNPKGAYP